MRLFFSVGGEEGRFPLFPPLPRPAFFLCTTGSSPTFFSFHSSCSEAPPSTTYLPFLWRAFRICGRPLLFSFCLTFILPLLPLFLVFSPILPTDLSGALLFPIPVVLPSYLSFWVSLRPSPPFLPQGRKVSVKTDQRFVPVKSLPGSSCRLFFLLPS